MKRMKILWVLAVLAVVALASMVSMTGLAVVSRNFGQAAGVISGAFSAEQNGLIGESIGSYSFADIISGRTYDLASDFRGKVVIIESFSTRCRVCATGIRTYNALYGEYNGKVQIVYLDISPADTESDILAMKAAYGGRDWIWVKHDEALLLFYERYSLYSNEQTIVIGKNGKIAYADSSGTSLQQIEEIVKRLV